MIAKHVAIRSLRKSSFRELVRYMCDPQDKRERVGHVQISNCHSLEVEDAILEVTATQARNVRCETDKTYHLILSFRAGEEPDETVLEQIEQHICSGLGYTEHQRISAVHHDTDNIHIHLAINKIHPSRLTLHSPFRDYKTLNQLCSTLEHEFGLERDNHQSERQAARGRAGDLEHAAGVESLIGWVRRECLEQITAADSWNALHQVMQTNGLSLQLRGNGLVITSADNTAIKASSVSRDISKAKLEMALGPFQACGAKETPAPAQQYQQRPMRSRLDTSELFARYQAEQKHCATTRAKAARFTGAIRDQQITAAKRLAALKRNALKLSGADRLAKKIILNQISKTLLAAIENARQQHKQACRELTLRYRQRSWHDWLQEHARQGDANALAALRARVCASGLKGNTLGGEAAAAPSPSTALPPNNITKQGTLIYLIGEAVIRDDGRALQISRHAKPATVIAALQLAAQRFGQSLSVNGSAEFKQQVLELAAQEHLTIRFNDPALEKQRLALVASKRQQSRKKTSQGVSR
ncbi:TraI/MobA(P) family conjugative relaxase [Pseudomonas sp.]|uniref:TraI/MobA(P) family conjugative relaxase n=1 Tax=Pseudomonas sp. TaxID=306 RepID=UPI003A979808